jgi:hypothetical protein
LKRQGALPRHPRAGSIASRSSASTLP